MMLVDKEKTTGQISAKKKCLKVPYIQASEYNKSEIQIGTRSSISESTSWGKEKTQKGEQSHWHFRSCP